MSAGIIDVRYYGGTYIARALGTKVRVSCTTSAEWAARRCALRCHYGRERDWSLRDFEHSGIELKEVTPNTFLVKWPEGGCR